MAALTCLELKSGDAKGLGPVVVRSGLMLLEALTQQQPRLAIRIRVLKIFPSKIGDFPTGENPLYDEAMRVYDQAGHGGCARAA